VSIVNFVLTVLLKVGCYPYCWKSWIGIQDNVGMWFQQDGAHFHRDARQYLDDNFTNIWIGRGSNNLLSPRSPDLKPLDFFLWGVLKERRGTCTYD
jgi:hypothetical protein